MAFQQVPYKFVHFFVSKEAKNGRRLFIVYNNFMLVSVRINGSLAQEIGSTRLRLDIPAPSTIEDLMIALGEQYPNSAESLTLAIPFVGGHHREKSASIQHGQEVALLMPAAGG